MILLELIASDFIVVHASLKSFHPLQALLRGCTDAELSHQTDDEVIWRDYFAPQNPFTVEEMERRYTLGHKFWTCSWITAAK